MTDILLQESKDGAVVDAALPFPGEQGVVKLFDAADWPVALIVGRELFTGACAMMATDERITRHPLNSYEIDYYYCRTSVVITLDAADPLPLMAQVVALSQRVSIYIQAKVCGEIVSDVVGVINDIDPPTLFPCGVAMFIAPGGGLYLAVNAAEVILPLKIYMTLTSGEFSRSGYITVSQGAR